MKGSNQFETVGNEVEFFLLCKNECQYKKRKIFGWKFVHWDYLESDYYQSNQTLEYMLAIILFDCRDWPYVRDFFFCFYLDT